MLNTQNVYKEIFKLTEKALKHQKSSKLDLPSIGFDWSNLKEKEYEDQLWSQMMIINTQTFNSSNVKLI